MTPERSLADGWQWVRFDDVVRQVKDKVDAEGSGLERFVAGEHMDTDDLRLQRWGEIGNGYLGPAFHMRFGPGQVLYGSRRTYLRKVAFADFEGICANTTFVLEPSGDEILPEFLPHVMSTERFHDHSVDQSKGSVNPYINFRDLTWFEFALPPVDQQREICALLSAAQIQVSKLDIVLQTTRAFRDSIIVEASNSAEQVPLRECIQSCDYGLSVTPMDVGDVPILRMNNLDGEELRLSDLKWVGSEQIGAADLLQPGDILFNRTNSLDHVGKVALVGGLGEPTAYASYLLRLRVDEESMLPEFLAAFLQSSVGQRRIRAYITQGVSQANVNATNLKKVKVPSLDLGSQRATIQRWEAVRNLQRAGEKHRTRTCSALATLREHLLEDRDV